LVQDEEAIASAASTRGAVSQAAAAADAGGAPDEAVGVYRTSMAVDAIKEALLRHLDAMWTSAKEHPSIVRLISLFRFLFSSFVFRFLRSLVDRS
jgi:hypothetical protein